MKINSSKNTQKSVRRFTVIGISGMVAVLAGFLISFKGAPSDYKSIAKDYKENGKMIAMNDVYHTNYVIDSTTGPEKGNRAASLAGFKKVYKVLMSPRCMNCHPVGDIPLQSDLSLPHTMNVQRGHDGKGLYALKCANCHQAKNVVGVHTPPGNPNWHLPPADMKMVFQGKSPKELATQLLNPNLNAHKDKEALIEHVSKDNLVVGCWNPGQGRTLPPMSHEEFVSSFKAWINNGAYIPD